MDITGKTALVTGANRGLGAALVEALVQAGAARVYAAVRSPGDAAAGGKVVPVQLDITQPAQIEALARRAQDVEILINNAGISLGQPLLAASNEAAEAEMRVNYFGTLAMARAFVPILAKNGGGALVNILSILARVSAGGSYSASKAAAYSLTQGLRAELSGKGTLVVGVMPGFVDTDMVKHVKQPKISPESVSAAVVHALQHGVEDVYPGPAAEIAAALQRDPKAVERQFATLIARTAQA